jgi:hypothetical protein
MLFLNYTYPEGEGVKLLENIGTIYHLTQHYPISLESLRYDGLTF